MAASFTVEDVKAAVAKIAAGMERAATELNELDGALGDGDLGVTMVRGTRAIANDPDLPADLGQALMKCAQGFTRTSGSTLGTLVATGLMAAAKVSKGKQELPWNEAAGLFGAALDAMAARGKAALGDKTVLDAMDAIRRAADGKDDPARLHAAAVAELQATLDRLRSQPARQGRARIFAEKTVGRDDPGMVAMLRVLEALA